MALLCFCSLQAGGSATAAAMPEIFEVTSTTPDACSDAKLGLCVVLFVDGSPLSKEDREKQLAVLNATRALPSNKVKSDQIQFPLPTLLHVLNVLS